MQNCDLPPPLKVFAGPDKTVLSCMNKVYSKMDIQDNGELHVYRNGFGDEKLELLKALRLSQTRAREAERKAAVLVKERERISNALLEESMRLFAYRQWVKLLELQVCNLPRQLTEEHMLKREDDYEGGGPEGSMSWFLALAFCLGIAGAGFVFSGSLLL